MNIQQSIKKEIPYSKLILLASLSFTQVMASWKLIEKNV